VILKFDLFIGKSYLMTTTDVSDKDDETLNEIKIDKNLGSKRQIS